MKSPQRDVLPIPDRTPVGLTTYDAKDPDTAFPPIEELRLLEGAPKFDPGELLRVAMARQ